MNNGGPAFPRSGSLINEPQRGMTLRDWFAGQALAGLIPSIRGVYKDNPKAGDNIVSELAEQAFEMADAMLKQRTLE